jgi:putative transposase
VKKRFSVVQITAVLQQAAQGVPVGDLCRKIGISEQSFYRWRKVYGSLQPSEARELKQLRDEVTSLKRLVADRLRGRALRAGKPHRTRLASSQSACHRQPEGHPCCRFVCYRCSRPLKSKVRRKPANFRVAGK